MVLTIAIPTVIVIVIVLIIILIMFCCCKKKGIDEEQENSRQGDPNNQNENYVGGSPIGSEIHSPTNRRRDQSI